MQRNLSTHYCHRAHTHSAPHTNRTTISPTQEMDRSTKRFFNGLTVADQKALLEKIFNSDALTPEAIAAAAYAASNAMES